MMRPKTLVRRLALARPRLPSLGVGCLKPRPLRRAATSLYLTQPGLPAWWRLASPRLSWLATFVAQLSWALLFVGGPLGASSPARPGVKTHWASTRDRLVTLTRGPIACKKQSRVQFILPKRPLRLTVCALSTEPTLLGRRALAGLAGRIRAEEGLWVQAVPAPLAVTRAVHATPVRARCLLLWA